MATIRLVRGDIKDSGSDPQLGTDESNDVGGWSIIPNMYYVHPINSRVTFGLGLSATSGTSTSYNKYWIGRYAALDTEIAMVDLMAALAWQVRDDLSVGVGIVAEHASLRIRQMVPLANPMTGAALKDGKMTIEGESIGFGLMAGVVYQPIDGTKIGLGYRSRIKHEADVDAELKGADDFKALGMKTSSDGDCEMELPSSINFGIEQRINDKWTVMMDIAWTEWSVMDELVVDFDNKILTSSGESKAMKWKDTWRFALGAEYKVNEKLTWRIGTSYDKNPAQDEYRNLKLPDMDRFWFSTGIGYKFNEKVRCDLAYTHLFMDTKSFEEKTAGGVVRGKSKSQADIYSFSVTYTF